jgi:hypothetical protein
MYSPSNPDRRTSNVGKPMNKNVGIKNRQTNIGETEDYDFWSMPNNESNQKRKEFVADSLLWVNDKSIDKSVFMGNHKNRGEEDFKK